MRTWWEVEDVVRGDVVRARECDRKPNQHGRTTRTAADSGECFPGVTPRGETQMKGCR
jgi:hypothetical protein